MDHVSRKRARLLACISAVLATVCGPASAPAAAATPSAGSPLAPELATLAEPAVAAAPEATQAEAMALPTEGPGSIVREGDDVVVEAHFESGAAARTEALEAAGATVLHTSRRYQTVALAVAPQDLEAVAAVPGLEAVEPSYEPVFYGAEEGAGVGTSAASNELCEGGAVTSQAMSQLRVAAARGTFGARGAGQTIGVLSDTFDTATEAASGGPVATVAADDEASNDLPGPASTCSAQQIPVRVLAEGPANGTDEGRAMLQAIHDLAPHAELAFATAYSTEVQFAHNIELLAAPVSAGGAGADVIVDDVGYFAEPFFQDGPVAVAIKKVTEAGVTYLTAAGNNNLFQGTAEIASWERNEFKDAACPAAVATKVGSASSSTCMNFSPNGTDATFGITVEPQSRLIVDLQWAEPWYGVETDLNAYLLNSSGTVIAGPPSGSVGVPTASTAPVSLLGWENKTSSSVEVQLAIDRCIQGCNAAANLTTKPRLKFVLQQNGGGVSATEYPQSNEGAGIVVGPTIYGHSGAAAAITLAAASYEQGTAPARPERYSSRGPVTHYFGPVVSSSQPAAALAQPEVLAKPDVTATDCASTTFFASLLSDGWHFCGTSQAAPHAAAVAALMRQTQPAATPASILAGLESSATPFSKVGGRSAVGAGLVNAEAAIAKVGGTAVNDPPSTVVGAVVGSGQEPPLIPPTASSTPNPFEQVPGPQPVGARPRVRILAHPRAVEKTGGTSVVGRFRFASGSGGVKFTCSVDRRAARLCGARFSRRFGIGRHVVKVRAVRVVDGVESAPAAVRFVVRRVGR